MSDEAPPPDAPVFPTLEELAALLPQYEFHEILGIGGMGAVYLARQSSLDRWVAIKLLPQSASQNPEDATRFITEARSMAKLTHSHIVAVYDFGLTMQGQLYLVMEYVEGLDLHRLIHRDEVNPLRIRSLVNQLCDALQYAHDHKIIHRDIKPANILVNADWQAKIVDFGLASQQETVMGEFEYGTPEYVAPERLEPGAVTDHRVDIYALGVCIHEMFTKKTPMAAGSSAMTGMPEAFATVIARCMAPDPAKRFQKASDIKNFLAIADTAKPSQPIPAAHKPAPPPHLQPKVKRPQHEVDVDSQGTGEAAKWLWAAAVVVLIAVGYWFIQNQRSTPQPVAQKKVKTEETTPPPVTDEKPVVKPDEPKMAETPAKGAEAPPVPAATVISNVPDGPFKPAAGDFAIEKRLQGHTDSIFAACILPDQRRVVTSGRDNTVRVWDAATGQQLKQYPAPVNIPANMVAAPQGTHVLIYSAAADRAAVFDIETGKIISVVQAPSSFLFDAAWAPDGKTVYLCCRDLDKGVFHWDPAAGNTLRQFADWPHAANQVLIRRDPATGTALDLIVVGGTLKLDGTAKNNDGTPRLLNDKIMAGVFSLGEQRIQRMLPDFTSSYNRLSISPDGTRAAGGSNSFAVFDAETFQRLITPPPPLGATFTHHSSWLAEGRILAISYSNGALRLMEVDTGTELATLSLGIRGGQLIAGPSGTWMVAAGFPLDSNARKAADFDTLIIRLPDLTKLGTDKGLIAYTSRQLSRLDTIDPELAALRKTAASAPDSIASDEQLIAALRDLTSKYGAALKRAAAAASPKDQLTMIAEADAIAAGKAVPDASTDAATAGEHKRFRGIYRQQIAQLETRRQASADSLRAALETGVKGLATRRQQAGDRLGSARCDALLASYGSLKPFATVIASAFSGSAPAAPAPMIATATPAPVTPPPAAPAPAPAVASAAPTGVKLQRIGKPGELIKIERTTKNGYISDSRSRVGSVPPTLGPVYDIACTNYHGLAIVADGSLKGWGSWSSGGAAYVVPADIKDAVMVATSYNESAAVLADGSVKMWSDNGNTRPWSPPGGGVIASITPQNDWGFLVITTDGRVHIASTFGTDTDSAPPATATDVVSITGDDDQTGLFAVKKDGSIIHWAKENIYIGQQHLNVKDALAVAESNNFLVVLHKDGTVDGWGEMKERQRFRVRKYPGATRVLPDPAGRIFLVQKAGNEWAAELNPANYDYYEEQRLGTIEGRIKGCTKVALSSMFVFAVKPAP